MDSHAAPAPTPLFVELSGTGVHHVFELDSEDRAFLVGSSHQADLRLDQPGIAAVEFHIERVADVACLVPAYRGRRLRVNGTPATSSVPLIGRALVALGALELELKVLHHQGDADRANRSSSAPRPFPVDYAATVPTDTAPTAVAMKPFEYSSANVPTQALTVRRPPMALNHQQTERMAPIGPPPLQFAQLTERLPPLAAPLAPSRAPSAVETQHTQRLAAVAAPAPAPAAAASRLPALERRESGAQKPQGSPPSAASAPLATQETTSFDVAVVGGAQARLPQQSASSAFLVQLGALTKQRPVLVLAGALMGALVLALALVGATRVTEPKRALEPPPRPTARGSGASAGAKPPARAPQAAQVASAPAGVVVAPTPEPKPSPRAAKSPVDPEVAAAVGHLAAGRISEASKAYGALAARPRGGEVYAKVAALLARRASGCSEGSTASCPEVLR
jgi:hypothetical protein